MSTSISDPYESPQEAALPRRKRTRLYAPPVWVWVVAIVSAAAITFLRVRAEAFDQAVVNIATLVLSFVVVLSATIWFLFFSAYPARWRLLVVSGATLGLLLLGFLFPVDHLDGALVPRFRWRWTPRPDELLGKPAAQDDSPVDLATTTPDDFPEFLGPDRSASFAGPANGLARDWKANPPKQLWRQPIGAGWSAFSAVNGFAVTLEQRGEDEIVTCYEARTGKLRWWYAIKGRHTNIMGGIGPRSTPTIHEGKVYALGATGHLHCLDGATGQPVWPSKDLLALAGSTPQLDEQRVMWGRAGSPLIAGKLVVVPFGGKPAGPWSSLIAFDKETGEEVWRKGDRQVGYSSPVLTTLCGVRQILIVNEDNVSGHDPQSGEVLWSHDWPGRSNTDANAAQVAPIPPDQFLLSKAYGGGAALVQLTLIDGRWTTKRLWHEKAVLKTKFTNVIVSGLAIYGLSDGILECVDLDTGKRQWKSGRYGQGQILGVGELILVQAETGEIVLCEANPERHVELGRFQAIEGVTWNNLCLHGRLLLVRNANEAACYELAEEK